MTRISSCRGEAADRFIGGPRQSLYALLLDPWFVRSIDYRFRRTDFVPIPRVDVVLLRFSKRGPPHVAPSDAQVYRDFVVHGYTAWQPTVRDAYRSVFNRHQLDEVGRRVNLNRRPTDVPAQDWLKLFEYFRDAASGEVRNRIDGAEQRLREQQATLRKERRTRTSRR